MVQKRTGYPSDVSDEEWALCAPYLVLMREDAPQRTYALRAVFNAVRYLVRAGCGWRMLPNDLPPWPVVHQQTQRWIEAQRFEMMAHDLREVLRVAAGRATQPTAAILDSRTVQLTPSSGARAGYDGAKRRKGSKVHAAVDTLGHVLALRVTAASDQDRAQVGELAADVQAATGETVELANWPMSIRVTPVPRRRQPPKRTGSSLRLSNPTTSNAALCCCRDAGSSNDHSAGPLAFAASPATTSDWQRPSRASTGSPLSVSCFETSSAKVHDSL